LIRALIFDLDGTLVQTEKLKALSYARAAMELSPQDIREADVIEAFKEVVGLPRREAAIRLLERFNLGEKARSRLAEFGSSAPWQVLVQLRQRYYGEIIADPDVIRSNQWPHNVSLLQDARRMNCKIGLATMSYCPEVTRILEILQLTSKFDFIASRDDVEQGKPDPEIYFLVARELAVAPPDCLVIEDSANGVKAALAAGMKCIAVATPFTRQGLHREDMLEARWIVDDPRNLQDVVGRMFSENDK
jgi:HAD superfamily hydrolase (TIGR01549 family)